MQPRMHLQVRTVNLNMRELENPYKKNAFAPAYGYVLLRRLALPRGLSTIWPEMAPLWRSMAPRWLQDGLNMAKVPLTYHRSRRVSRSVNKLILTTHYDYHYHYLIITTTTYYLLATSY